MRKILLFLTLTSCGAHIPINDHVVYGDKGVFGATQVHTLFTNIAPIDIDRDTWNQMRVGMVCTQVADFAGIQKTVDQLCAQDKNNCTYEQQQAVAAFKIAIHRILVANRNAGIPIDPLVMRLFYPSALEVSLTRGDALRGDRNE